ncbi:VOC family protein [Persephonella sp.]
MEELLKNENSVKKDLDFRPYNISINMTVKDPESSRDFYKNLGFEETYRWSDDDLTVIHMKLNNLILELFSFKNNNHSSEDQLAEELKITGVKHLVLKVDDIKEARQFLSDKGVINKDTKIIKETSGIQYFFLKDPDGIFVEIVQEDKKM